MTVQYLIDILSKVEDKTKIVVNDYYLLPIVGVEEDGRYVELISLDNYGTQGR